MSGDSDGIVQARRSRHRDRLWVALGCGSLALGAVGAVLPLLPTTPFVILAAFAFGKGSPRLRRWLIAHRVFGSAIQDWETHGAIARRYKYLACAVMALTFAVSALAGLSWWILLIQALCMVPAAFFVATRPDGPT